LPAHRRDCHWNVPDPWRGSYHEVQIITLYEFLERAIAPNSKARRFRLFAGPLDSALGLEPATARPLDNAEAHGCLRSNGAPPIV
jgi:hypothetical protein